MGCSGSGAGLYSVIFGAGAGKRGASNEEGHVRRRFYILATTVLAVVAALTAGCNGNRRSLSNGAGRGLVILLSGAGGDLSLNERIRQGLERGGVPYTTENFVWSRGELLSDQTDVEANRRMAGQLARRIEDYLDVHPGRPVHLIGLSAGTGLAVWALEDLAPGCKVTAAFLLASSLEARYDLGPALRAVRDRIYVFFSPVDTVLSLGVTWAGTVDRGGGLSGGLLSFGPPAGSDEETRHLYREKLVQYGWTPADVLLGHLGDHLGVTSPGFVAERIAPLVLGEAAAAAPADPDATTALAVDDTSPRRRRKRTSARPAPSPEDETTDPKTVPEQKPDALPAPDYLDAVAEPPPTPTDMAARVSPAGAPLYTADMPRRTDPRQPRLQRYRGVAP